MSNIQEQIKDAELNAEKEIALVKEHLAEKSKDAHKKASDLLASSKNDADKVFSSKKELLEMKLNTQKEDAKKALEKQIEEISAKKDDLIKRGVEFLLTRLA